MTATPLSGPEHIRRVRASITRALVLARRAVPGAAEQGADVRAAVEAAEVLACLIGQSEDPKGSNKSWAIGLLRESTDYGKSYCSDDWGAWCAYAAHGAWGLGIQAISLADGKQYRRATPVSGSTARWWHKAVESGHAIHVDELRSGRAQARIGDAWIRNNDPGDVHNGGSGSGGHTGLTAAYKHRNRTIWTVEGNTDAFGWDANGGTVAAKSIDLDDPRLVGIIRLEVES